jgi:hypothetical protein
MSANGVDQPSNREEFRREPRRVNSLSRTYDRQARPNNLSL